MNWNSFFEIICACQKFVLPLPRITIKNKTMVFTNVKNINYDDIIQQMNNDNKEIGNLLVDDGRKYQKHISKLINRTFPQYKIKKVKCKKTNNEYIVLFGYRDKSDWKICKIVYMSILINADPHKNNWQREYFQLNRKSEDGKINVLEIFTPHVLKRLKERLELDNYTIDDILEHLLRIQIENNSELMYQVRASHQKHNEISMPTYDGIFQGIVKETEDNYIVTYKTFIDTDSISNAIEKQRCENTKDDLIIRME